jgi:hypothetical protein
MKDTAFLFPGWTEDMKVRAEKILQGLASVEPGLISVEAYSDCFCVIIGCRSVEEVACLHAWLAFALASLGSSRAAVER